MTFRHEMARRRGDTTGDGALYGTLLLALLGIILLMVGSEWSGGLVGFSMVTVWVNGPLGIFLPATYEPILMLFGRIYPPLLIATLGTAGILYVEMFNFSLYAHLLKTRALSPLRDTFIVRHLTTLFGRAPFVTVWLCSWSPLPYWSVRILAPLSRYSLTKYLLATALGRFPRLWFFAWLGPAIHLSTATLTLITVGSILTFLLVAVLKGNAHRIRAASGE